jgi:replicative DNA helicase
MAQVRISRSLDQAGIRPEISGIEFERHIPTGFADFDRLVGGLTRPSLMAIGGDYEDGKTALGVNIARHVSVKLDLRTVIFSSISRWQIAQRFLSIESGVDRSRILEGRFSQRDLTRLTAALEVLSLAPIYIDDRPEPTINQFQQRASSLNSAHSVDVVMVDDLEVPSSEGSEASFPTTRLNCSDGDVRGMKSASRELNCALVVFFETLASSPMPQQEHARLNLVPEALLQHCDCIVLIERADEDSERRGLIDLHVIKNREGPIGACSLLFMEQTGRVIDPGAHP